ncbi:MAG: DUF4282 domain-containing protein [Pirellulales bacterium]
MDSQTSTDDVDFPAITTSTHRFRSAVRHRFRPASSWLDIFDWKFEKYLTPWIVRATWMICVCQAFIWLAVIVLFTLWSWVPDVESPRHDSQPAARYERPNPVTASAPEWLTSRIGSTVAGLTAICVVVIGLLWIRVVLEVAIVLFNIATTVTSIDEKTGNSHPPS